MSGLTQAPTLQADSQAIWWAGVQAVQPKNLIQQWVTENLKQDQKNSPSWLGEANTPYSLLAIGKAASAMAQAWLAALPHHLPPTYALVVTKHGHGAPLDHVTVLEADHPVPGEASLAAAKAVTQFCQQPHHKVVVLLSGGASALLADLPDSITLADWQTTTHTLLASGADIHTINAIRTACSTLKGGRLLAALQLSAHKNQLTPPAVITLAISDVVGDNPSSIGSGLTTTPNATVWQQQIQQWFNNPHKQALPPSVEQVLQAFNPFGATTPPKQNELNTQFICIGTAQRAVQAAAQKAIQLGYTVTLSDTPLCQLVATEAQHISMCLQQSGASLSPDQPLCHLWWGEPTVVLPAKPGKGGRNQHLALAVAVAMHHQDSALPHSSRQHWHLLAGGTDGTDGPTTEGSQTPAGGWVDSHTISKAQQLALSLNNYLATADSGTALATLGQLWQTGPTHTNVMDLVVALQRV
jgi:glycerate 2-kinase